ncbi:hypothetical protein HYH03_013164 [Edaphochlamys debaryana]|uniref:Uncharacterized protein n=1 Tax=Edaphochlamys debaryana TaxID=47281 RepID=A0A835XZ61_9CHLO|nr:hypothetical protein HYH03_013164 [Edaphochlamys debaryana]|eukprot:KAG2488314.1 hypothetical protein HYH03_013164 [Edaphochlamys debaryana]
MEDGVEDAVDALQESAMAMRVKDHEAWKGTNSPRPRSALKHGSSSASMASDASAVERTPSGRRVPRKVSFQVQGLSAPDSIVEQQDEGLGRESASKRVKGSEEFSMKFLVEKFYGKVLQHASLKPFFDGVDMYKLKHQQEALMLLVFGGHELLEDELPGLSADLRLIHLHLLFEGLNLTHWQLFSDTFSETLDELHQIPAEVRAHAKTYMASTKHYFRPIEPQEWPPKVVYKGWTKRSCPFHTSYKRMEPEAAAADGEEAAGAGPSHPEKDDDEFVLPGINSPATGLLDSGAKPEAGWHDDEEKEAAKQEREAAEEAAKS